LIGTWSIVLKSTLYGRKDLPEQCLAAGRRKSTYRECISINSHIASPGRGPAVRRARYCHRIKYLKPLRFARTQWEQTADVILELDESLDGVNPWETGRTFEVKISREIRKIRISRSEIQN
jgi:hypothetical protein